METAQDHVFSQKLLGSIGGVKTKTVISELYSPPRVAAEIRRSQNEFLTPGFAFDIIVNDHDDGRPWDFSIPAKREKAREILRKQRPYVLIGSPMCTAFSTWQFLTDARRSNAAAAEAAEAKAIQHMNFAASFYLEQI